MIVVHFNIGQQSKIIARGQTIKMRLEISVQRTFARSFVKCSSVSFIGEQLDAIALEPPRLACQRYHSYIFAGQLARNDFAGLDVEPIEWTHAARRAADRRQDF